ncbi:hypothetical protein C4D60_Mb07t27760 [Musa balbisiana]|uniref:Uncharacterized protein n=1 Tax=Musa balbisiana TaxID=52838 RepID=A0A4S8JJ99_MUSBA|nr:hypothetical protein C4D60_Mb07t27760 [Musa balbisiana]
MGLLHPIDSQRPFHLLLSVLILLSSSQVKLLVQGRSVFRLLEYADVSLHGENSFHLDTW